MRLHNALMGTAALDCILSPFISQYPDGSHGKSWCPSTRPHCGVEGSFTFGAAGENVPLKFPESAIVLGSLPFRQAQGPRGLARHESAEGGRCGAGTAQRAKRLTATSKGRREVFAGHVDSNSRNDWHGKFRRDSGAAGHGKVEVGLTRRSIVCERAHSDKVWRGAPRIHLEGRAVNVLNGPACGVAKLCCYGVVSGLSDKDIESDRQGRRLDA